jgi:hypothetical protein
MSGRHIRQRELLSREYSLFLVYASLVGAAPVRRKMVWLRRQKIDNVKNDTYL